MKPSDLKQLPHDEHLRRPILEQALRTNSPEPQVYTLVSAECAIRPDEQPDSELLDGMTQDWCVRWPASGRLCALALQAEHIAQLLAGEDVTVYMFRSPSGTHCARLLGSRFGVPYETKLYVGTDEDDLGQMVIEFDLEAPSHRVDPKKLVYRADDERQPIERQSKADNDALCAAFHHLEVEWMSRAAFREYMGTGKGGKGLENPDRLWSELNRIGYQGWLEVNHPGWLERMRQKK